jgi:hypothetical protein
MYDKYIEDGKSNFFIQDCIRYQPTHKSHPIEITQHGDRIQACNPYSIALIKRGRVERMETRKKRRQKRQGYKFYCQKRN